jgi:sulfur relay (sulfurtransferase) complex TusBCD TusD component (DsrE family)
MTQQQLEIYLCCEAKVLRGIIDAEHLKAEEKFKTILKQFTI